MMTFSSARTVPSLLAEQAHLGGHPAVIEEGRKTSYSQLWDLVRQAARGFLAAGIQHGDRVAVWAPNSLEFIVAMLGAQTIGAPAVPLSTRFTGHEAAEVLRRSGTSLLAVTDGFLNKSYTGMLKEAGIDDGAEGSPIPGLPDLHTIVRLDNIDAGENEISWDTVLAQAKPTAEDAR